MLASPLPPMSEPRTVSPASFPPAVILPDSRGAPLRMSPPIFTRPMSLSESIQPVPTLPGALPLTSEPPRLTLPRLPEVRMLPERPLGSKSADELEIGGQIEGAFAGPNGDVVAIEIDESNRAPIGRQGGGCNPA